MADNHGRPTLGASIYYEDPKAALDWLERAFGFEMAMVITAPDGSIAHSEMTFGDAYIMVGKPWADFITSPNQAGGKNTQMVHLHLTTSIDEHCERARAAGAVIQQEPETQFYGDRTYRCKDIGGHVWTFSQTVEVLSVDQWDANSDGLKTTLGPGWKG